MNKWDSDAHKALCEWTGGEVTVPVRTLISFHLSVFEKNVQFTPATARSIIDIECNLGQPEPVGVCGSAVQDVCGVCNGDGSSCIAVPISSESPDFDMPGCEIRARLGTEPAQSFVLCEWSLTNGMWLQSLTLPRS